MRQKIVKELRRQALIAMPKDVKKKGPNATFYYPEDTDTIICPYKNFIREYRRQAFEVRRKRKYNRPI